MIALRPGLEAEIEFWKDLIIELSSGINSPEYKRLEFSLERAQSRLFNRQNSLMESVTE
jgi:hypothetical protein